MQGTVSPKLLYHHLIILILLFSPSMLGTEIKLWLHWCRLPTPPPPGEALHLLLVCRKEEEPISFSASLLLPKGHNHCLLWFCEHFMALWGAGLRLPIYFLLPLNNYQLVEAVSWMHEVKFMLLAGGKQLFVITSPLCSRQGDCFHK